ncbi:MAG: methyltransferase [Muribaculaceae bacterium]|nr:methyltransferase [Muribaculaceae bacterium]
MDKKEVVFRFKRFNMNHGLSSMRIGVDAVLLGAWCDVRNTSSVLDVGTGCGVIALMIAQRLPYGEIEGIEIDLPSVEEASKNFASSLWKDRCHVSHIDFLTYVKTYKDSDRTENHKNEIDLIVSNPPYFDSGVKTYSTSRLLARHQGSELSPTVLLREGARILSCRGRIAIIVPKDVGDKLENEVTSYGLMIIRKCYVRGHDKAPYKRVLMEFGRYENCRNEIPNTIVSYLTLEEKPGTPTEDYRELCKEFYLKF